MSTRSRNKRRTAKAVTRGNTALMERDEPQDNAPIPLYEAKGKRGGGAAISKAFSLAWDETEAMGITADMRRSGPGMLSDQDRKETLYQAYLNSVWISACVDVIAKRITSGGIVIELTEKGEDESAQSQAEYDQLHEFLHYINEDEDFLQLIRSIATDLLIYGEAYLEIVMKAGKPYSLHKIDCSTMNYKLDKHGTVVQYIQNMTHSTDTVLFEPGEVIRFWLPDPKANKKALSPIERILGPVDADAHMADWVRAFFRKGARPPFWIEFPGSREEASRFVVWLRENYTGQANAHVPMVLYEGSKLNEIGKGSIDMDFAKGREMMRQEILAGYQVPPAIVSQIESGNIGGGTGDSQDKSFQFNACDPVRQLIFEKFNYRVVNKGFGITNWRVGTRYSDFRSDLDIIKIDDTRIRNGSSTINEVRAETGKHPVDGGDEAVVVASKDIIPVMRLKAMSTELTQQTQIGIQQAQAQLDMTKVQIDKAKNPPLPPPTIVQQTPLPDEKKPVPDEKEQQQERHLLALQMTLTHTNETLARLDEQLRIARNAYTYDAETTRFKETLISELQWLKENEVVFVEDVRQEVATLRSLIEAKEEPHEDHDTTPDETPFEATSEELSGRETVVVDSTRSDQTLLQQESESDTSPVEDGRPEVVQHHTGIMIALNVDPEIATQLAISGGEPASEFHVTLCYMGSTEDEPEPGKLHPAHTQDTIKTLLSSLAATSEPLHGVVGGLARFLPSDSSDWKSPVIALVNVQGLQQWRQKLVDTLDMAGYVVAQDFDYTPHCSITYIAPDAPMPITTLPALPLDFYGMELCIGDDVTYFPFAGGETPHEETAQSQDETSTKPSPTTEQTGEARVEPDATDHPPAPQDDESRGVEGQSYRDSEDHPSMQPASTDAADRPGTESVGDVGELAEDETATEASGRSDQQPGLATLTTKKNVHTRRQRKSSKSLSIQNIDIVEEQRNDQQETPAQSTESDDESTRENEAQGDGSLHPVQEPGSTDDTGAAESDTRDVTSESSNTEEASGTDGDSDCVVETQSLKSGISRIFRDVCINGTAAMDKGGGRESYLFTEQDKAEMANLLKSAYLDAKVQAYQRAQETARHILKIQKPWKPLRFENQQATEWAEKQVESITETYWKELSNQLANITEEAIGDGIRKIIKKVNEWIHGFIPWKSKQIADNTQSTGDNAGTSQWIEDAGSADGDPNGVRVRVVPEESSNDYCKEYAGNDYSLEEANGLPDFPAHPNCRHSLEVYLVEGDE